MRQPLPRMVKEHSMEETAIYENHLKGEYMVENGSDSLVISPRSCYRLGEETLWLIANLPAKGSQPDFLGALSALGLIEADKIYTRLLSIGVLRERQVRPRIKTALKWLINPDIRLIPAKFQERVLALAGFSKPYSSGKTLAVLFTGLSVIGAVAFLPALFNITQSHIGAYLFGLIAAGSMVHELGHSMAAAYAGIGLRPVGFSVYLFYPVFYTNVSGMENLTLRKKLLVDCGGFIAQSGYMLALGIISLATGNSIYAEAVRWIMLIMLFNLNPFMRTDFYWIYADIRGHFSGHTWMDKLHVAYLTTFLGFTGWLLYHAYNSIINLVTSGYGIILQPDRVWHEGYKIIIGSYFVVMVITGGLRRIKESHEELKATIKKIPT